MTMILPFLEYELHNQLVNKLKIRSMNGLFGLKMQFVVGESMLIGVATATGAYLVPLPAPPVPKILVQVTSEEENVKLQELHIKIAELIQKNKDLYQLNVIDISSQPSPRSTTTEDSDDDSSDMDLSFNNKDTFVLEVDDAKDETIEAMLEDIQQPLGMELCNTETCPGISHRVLKNNLQMFTQVFRRKIDLQQNLKLDFKEMFNSVYRRLFFKLRRMMPCCLYNLAFNIDAPLEDELEIIVTGVCVAIDEWLNQSTSYIMTPMSTSYIVTPGSAIATKPLLGPASNTDVSQVGVTGDCNEMMFPLEEVTDGPGMPVQQKMSRQKSETTRKKPKQILIQNIGQQIQGIEITPLFYVSGCKIERYLGSYNFFFIRETTSVREIGGICGFMQKFIMEVLAIVRANVASLGGNALVAFNMAQCVLLNNEHKNQSQCLINVCGDAVYASKDLEATAAMVPDTSRKQSDCLLSINVT